MFTTHFRILCIKLLQMRWPYNTLYFYFSNCSVVDFCQENKIPFETNCYHLKRKINYLPYSIMSLAKRHDFPFN